MCGIVFMENVNGGRVSKHVFGRYKSQETRGKQGYGCVEVIQNKVDKVRRSVNETGIKSMLPSKASMILFHHRTPTSTPNFEECTHPILVSNDLLKFDYFVVHNGMIINASTTKTEFEKMGFKYSTIVEHIMKCGNSTLKDEKSDKFNDSESFAIDIALCIEDPTKDQIKSTGSIAFVALQVNKKNHTVENVFYGRNTNPLKIDRARNRFTLASEGAGVDVETHELFCYSPHSQQVTKRDLNIGYVAPVSSVHKTYDYSKDHTSVYGKEQKITTNYKNHDVKRRHDPIIGSSISINSWESGKKIERKIEYDLQGDFLFKTKIHFSHMTSMTLNDWTWYCRIMDDIEKNIIKAKDIKNQVGIHTQANKDIVNTKLRNLHRELGVFSDQVMLRIYKEKREEIRNHGQFPLPLPGPREARVILSDEDERKLAVLEREDM